VGIHAERRDWSAAATAQRMVTWRRTPRWVHRACAARRIARGGLSQLTARPALDRFPKEPTVAYNLACRALGRGDA
jgi:hypothetical protein